MKIRHRLVYLYLVAMALALLVALPVAMIAFALVVVFPFAFTVVLAVVLIGTVIGILPTLVAVIARAPPLVSSAKAGSNAEMEASKMRSGHATLRVQLALNSWHSLRQLMLANVWR